MNTILRSVGLAALGAVAITIVTTQAPRPSKGCDAFNQVSARQCAFEQLVWDLVRDSGEESEIEAYLQMYPRGRYVGKARRTLMRMLPGYGVLPPVPSPS